MVGRRAHDVRHGRYERELRFQQANMLDVDLGSATLIFSNSLVRTYFHHTTVIIRHLETMHD